MKAAGEPGLRTRDLVVMMGGSQPLHPGSTPGVCTSIDAILGEVFRVVEGRSFNPLGSEGPEGAVTVRDTVAICRSGRIP